MHQCSAITNNRLKKLARLARSHISATSDKLRNTNYTTYCSKEVTVFSSCLTSCHPEIRCSLVLLLWISFPYSSYKIVLYTSMLFLYFCKEYNLLLMFLSFSFRLTFHCHMVYLMCSKTQDPSICVSLTGTQQRK